MIAIIDYGMGNLHSVYNALQAIGAQAEITSDPEQLKQADGIILPGRRRFPRLHAQPGTKRADRHDQERSGAGQAIAGHLPGHAGAV